MTNLTTAIRSILFSIFIPGLVSVVLPLLLNLFFPDVTITSSSGLAILGSIIVTFGALGYFWTVLSFFNQGGTPQIYFMTKLQKVFGIEPDNLVNSGLYGYSRNPMYLSVFLVTFGLSLALNHLFVLIWALIFFVLVNIVVIFIEEPHLKEKYGESYQTYLNTTYRWIGRK